MSNDKDCADNYISYDKKDFSKCANYHTVEEIESYGCIISPCRGVLDDEE